MKKFEKYLNNILSKTKETILISNVNIEDFSCKIVINSNMPQKELAVVGSHPAWLIELELLSKKKETTLLIIKDIDSITTEEQLKFLDIIKYRSINGFQLPDNTHIILTYSDLEKVADKIKSHSIVLKAE